MLFIDEIHRYNKAQQDALLQAVEDGTVTLIGATTENPSFEVIGALLSRTKVLTLQPLSAGGDRDHHPPGACRRGSRTGLVPRSRSPRPSWTDSPLPRRATPASP